MEYYQVIQNRALQTAAVVQAKIPALSVAGKTAADLITTANALEELAQARDNALTDYDAAVNAEHLGFSSIRTLTLTLPGGAEAELDEARVGEADLADLLDPAYAIVPRTTELALARGKKVFAALGRINGYLLAQTPPRGPITVGGKTAENLRTAMEAQPALELAIETTATDVTTARADLRNPANVLDRLNKRFYKLLEAEARTNGELAAALGQIDTTGASLPATLGIRALVQGGTNGLQIVVSYDNGSYDATLTNTLEWLVVGVDADFTQTIAAAPSGNEIGPFPVGQQVKLRTRTRNGSGTTTGSVRTLTLLAPG